MLRKVLTGMALCACTLGLAPLALGTGFEFVYDSANHMTAL
jgi:hypothetical protein